MNRPHLRAHLDDAFHVEIALLHPYGGVFAGDEPVDLDEVVRAACDDDREGDELVGHGIPDLGLEILLSFDWEGAGPGLTSQASLELLRLNPHKPYVVFRDEVFGQRVFGAVSEPLAMFMPHFVQTFFGSNGMDYGGRVFSSIPTGTHNSRPDLILERTLRDGYREFLNWATRHSYAGWESFDPLAWAEHLMDEVPSVDDFANRLEEASPEEEHEILLDVYFKHCYAESG